MAHLTNYKELFVWQKAIGVVKEIYTITEHFPKNEIFGLTSQMRRSAISIPSNIAEGYGRKSTKEYIQFLRIAYGSALELETQIIIAKELDYLTSDNFDRIILSLTEILKMLNAMTHKLTDLNAKP